MNYEDLYNNLLGLVESYLDMINNIDFAWPERTSIPKKPENPEELLYAVNVIIESSKELNQVFENSPASLFIADALGKTLRVNKTFVDITGTNRQDMFGKNVLEIEKEGTLKPSVCALTLKEKCRVSVLQQVNEVKDIVVTGVPVFDEKGKIFRVVTSAFLLQDITNLSRYIYELKRNNIVKEDVYTHLIGESASMHNILDIVDLVKNTSTSIMLTGETGVGKGVLAQYIHETSNRSKYKMVEINCGAIPEKLFESELFGYDSGAFTGADKKGKPGLIEIADKGTLFLDELSELPLHLQVKLLNFLQKKKITRVGGTAPIEVDVRIISASNRPLPPLIAEGLFRSDLYYRLNVVPIEIEPLRDRKDDIIPTALHFIKKYGGKYDKDLNLTEEFKSILLKKRWMGNTRELENYIERRVVIGFDHEDLNQCSEVVDSENEVQALKKESEKQESPIKETYESLEDLEKRAVLAVYDKYRSSYKVAEILGVSQSTAYRKIQKYCK